MDLFYFYFCCCCCSLGGLSTLLIKTLPLPYLHDNLYLIETFCPQHVQSSHQNNLQLFYIYFHIVTSMCFMCMNLCIYMKMRKILILYYSGLQILTGTTFSKTKVLTKVIWTDNERSWIVIMDFCLPAQHSLYKPVWN